MGLLYFVPGQGGCQVKRWILRGGLALTALLLIIQLVPYGRNHTNPPVRSEPAWNSAETRALVVQHCFACHSNQNEWPWYSRVAPVSWLIQRDVDEGRQTLNFSEWDRPQEEAGEAAETVREGEMPPWYYYLPRPQERLSSAERTALIAGLAATLGERRER
jgi:mono/diheme cytochrome c family protein